MKNRELRQAKILINQIKDKGTNDCKIALIFIEMELDRHIEVIEGLVKPSAKIEKFQQEQRELLLQHGETDKEGNIIVYNEKDGKGGIAKSGFGIPNIVKNKKEFETKHTQLEKKYEQDLKTHNDKVLEYEKTLDKPVKPELKIAPLLKKDLPEEIPFDILKAFIKWKFIKI